MKYIDPSISRKSVLIDDSVTSKNNILLPSLVEINESGICNRTCSFCPKSNPLYPNEKIFVSKKLIYKLCRELSDLNYSGIFCFSGFCEPLLDKNIYSLVAIARDNLLDAKIELVTNGDALNKKNMKKLFNAGLTTLLVSAYDGVEQVSYFEDMAKDIGIDKRRVIIRPRYLPQDESFGITLNNRSGMMADAEYKIKPLIKPMVRRCNYPFYSFFMDYNGDVLLCAHDWGKNMIVGNIEKSSFLDIWNGKKFNYARSKLIKGNRELSPCNVCDVDGTIMGNAHVKNWKENY